MLSAKEKIKSGWGLWFWPGHRKHLVMISRPVAKGGIKRVVVCFS